MPITIRSDLAKRGILEFTDFLAELKTRGILLRDTLDVGAFRGDTVKTLLPHTLGTLYAYEPITDAPLELTDHRKLVWRRLGLSDMSGTARFATPSDHYTDTLSPRGYVREGLAPRLKQFYGRLVRKETANLSEIHLTRGDDDLPSNASIDLAKIDIQGGELKALRGLAKHLPFIDFLWVEYTGSQPGLLSYLEKQGFDIFESAYVFETVKLGALSRRSFRPIDQMKLAPGLSGLRATRVHPWANFGAEFQYLKRFEGMVQTDMACIRRNRLADLNLSPNGH